MSNEDVVFLLVSIVFSLFPVGYAFALKVENKLLFIMASFGGQSFIVMLIMVASIPFVLLSMFAFPQLDFLGYMDNLKWLMDIAYFIGDYWWLLFWTIPPTVFPFILYRRYKGVFGSHSS